MRCFVNIGYLTKVNINSLNSGESPGTNIVVIKRLQDSKGDYYVYVSGQALRYYLKETMNELGMPLTKIDKKGKYKINASAKGKERYKEIVRNHPDLDLFGFMEAVREEKEMALRRWSPVKVSPLISIYPWKGESDLLTRRKEGQAGGDLVKVEVNAFNFMRGTIMVDVDAVGSYVEEGSYVDEISYEREMVRDEKDKENKKRRLGWLIEAIKNLDGGAKKARLLDDLTPKFVVITKQKAGTPIFLNSLHVSEDGSINIMLVKEALEEYKTIIEESTVGIRSGIFKNEEEVKKELGATTVNIAIDKIKEWLELGSS